MKKFRLPPETMRHYKGGAESGRLDSGGGYLERVRTQEIVARFLPKHQIDILDVGGGPGVYSAWLANLGHRIHLIDAVPSHIKQARAKAWNRQRELFSAEVGDARRLSLPDASLFGGHT